MAERAIKTISQPAAIELRRRRTASRIRRLTRLRATAFPMRLLTAKPKRLCFKSLGRAHKTINPPAQDLPFRRTRWKSVLSLRRYLRANPYVLDLNHLHHGSALSTAQLPAGRRIANQRRHVADRVDFPTRWANLRSS